ncbi:MAG: hypothetical protein ACLQFR_19845 [Streptosporangiaceae bacterium]
MADEQAVPFEHGAESQVERIVSAAAAAVGRPFSEPVALRGGSGRSVLLRCRDGAGGAGGAGGQGTVIVKTYPDNGDGRSSFAAEAAGLQLASGTGLAPDFLGADRDRLVVVMSDLGAGESMADVLLGSSAPAAKSGLMAWARACGALSAAVGLRQPEFDALRADYLGGRADESYMAGLAGRILAAAQACPQVGVTPPAGLGADLAEVAGVVARQAVFSPGDICPDNNILTADGIRFIDFESAGFHSVFLDAAYIRMPFSTCWCVFRLPPEISAAAEAAYRSAVCAVRPELADDEIWQRGVRLGVAAWTLSALRWLLRSAIEADEPTDAEAESPRTRQLIRYRWQTLADELEVAGELPTVAGLMRSLLAATQSWQAPELPLYPAFR